MGLQISRTIYSCKKYTVDLPVELTSLQITKELSWDRNKRQNFLDFRQIQTQNTVCKVHGQQKMWKKSCSQLAEHGLVIYDASAPVSWPKSTSHPCRTFVESLTSEYGFLRNTLTFFTCVDSEEPAFPLQSWPLRDQNSSFSFTIKQAHRSFFLRRWLSCQEKL